VAGRPCHDEHGAAQDATEEDMQEAVHTRMSKSYKCAQQRILRNYCRSLYIKAHRLDDVILAREAPVGPELTRRRGSILEVWRARQPAVRNEIGFTCDQYPTYGRRWLSELGNNYSRHQQGYSRNP